MKKLMLATLLGTLVLTSSTVTAALHGLRCAFRRAPSLRAPLTAGAVRLPPAIRPLARVAAKPQFAPALSLLNPTTAQPLSSLWNSFQKMSIATSAASIDEKKQSESLVNKTSDQKLYTCIRELNGVKANYVKLFPDGSLAVATTTGNVTIFDANGKIVHQDRNIHTVPKQPIVNIFQLSTNIFAIQTSGVLRFINAHGQSSYVSFPSGIIDVTQNPDGTLIIASAYGTYIGLYTVSVAWAVDASRPTITFDPIKLPYQLNSADWPKRLSLKLHTMQTKKYPRRLLVYVTQQTDVGRSIETLTFDLIQKKLIEATGSNPARVYEQMPLQAFSLSKSNDSAFVYPNYTTLFYYEQNRLQTLTINGALFTTRQAAFIDINRLCMIDGNVHIVWSSELHSSVLPSQYIIDTISAIQHPSHLHATERNLVIADAVGNVTVWQKKP